MKVDVSTAIVINQPRGLVSAYAGDPTNAPDWYVNIKSVEWQGQAAVKVGARIAFVAHFLGKRLAYTYEITELIPGELLVMRTSQGPFPMETRYTWEEAGNEGTRMTLRNRGEPSGFSSLMAPFMSSAMRRANRKDLQLLKKVLESSST